MKNTQWKINLFDCYEIIIKSFSILHTLFNCVLPAIYFACFFPAVLYMLKWLLFSPEVFFDSLLFIKIVFSQNFSFHVSEFLLLTSLSLHFWVTKGKSELWTKIIKINKRVIFFNDSSLGILPLLAFGFSAMTEQDVYLRSLEGKLVQVVKSYVAILVVVIRRLIQRENQPHPGFEENARLPRLLNQNKTCF